MGTTFVPVASRVKTSPSFWPRARPASTSRRRRKPPNYRLRLRLHCGVTWQTSQTARRLLSPNTRNHLSPGYRSQPVAQVPDLDNVIAQPVELGDDADR